jgi:D-tyrosyl-tRNA(Tyr) deacylase
MRALIQRVSQASVNVEGQVIGRIGPGLLVLAAVEAADTDTDVEWLSGKIVRLRVFDDEAGLMNRSIQDVGGNLLLISQFTLFASTRKGNRPSFIRSAPPELAAGMVDRLGRQLEKDLGQRIEKGRFGAHMEVQLTNDGPVTVMIDSKLKE